MSNTNNEKSNTRKEPASLKQLLIQHSKKLWLILAILFITYGIVIAMENTGSPFFLFWFVLGFGAIVMILVSHFHLWQRLPHIIRKIIAVLLFLATALFLFVEGCIVSQFFAKGESNLDCIIVLGAQVREDGPSRVLRYRLDVAYDYLESNPETICIVSGGQGFNEPWSEAEGMYRYLIEKGIDPSRIRKEGNSINTVQNITFSAQFLDREADHVGIVTNNFHVFRATSLAKHAGYQHVSGIASGGNTWFSINNMVREFFGILKDSLTGHLL
jgi:uncharacterized SAM-binding protein YcdF (DUF218 family)